MFITRDMVDQIVSSRPSENNKVMYCKVCGHVYHLVPAGEPLWNTVKGRWCDCSWGCCQERGVRHIEHLAYRDATPEEEEHLDTWCRACMGKPRGSACSSCNGTKKYKLSDHVRFMESSHA